MKRRLKWRWRWFAKMYANHFGFFWDACPICGEYFGGQEWDAGRDWGGVLMHTPWTGEGTCPDCFEEAARLNAKSLPRREAGEVVYFPTLRRGAQ